MNDVESILDGVEALLGLMRELGVRSVEIDRSILSGTAERKVSPAQPARPSMAATTSPPQVAPPAAVRAANAGGGATIAFLHDAPLSEAGADMMGKIVAALNGDSTTMPVVHSGSIPQAKAYVVLGARALKKWFPRISGAPGDRVYDEKNRRILITYSPAYILRFPVVTPAVRKVKLSMWKAIMSICSEARQAK